MKVYVVMKWVFDDERDELIDVYRNRNKAMEKCKELADESVMNRSDRRVIKGYECKGKHWGYIVQWFDTIENDVENWEHEKLYYVVEKEVKN